MEVEVPVMIKDPSVKKWKGTPYTENHTIKGEDHFLDGPVTPRVAVLDFDPSSGALAEPARFLPPKRAGDKGRYDIPAVMDDTLMRPQVMQVITFGGVYKTLAMFEEADTLGRRVQWAFPGPQLLVVPRAGEWANAFYERDSRSLQLFYIPGPGGRHVYTCQSQDIIAHETAHAAIDGIVPDLYHATDPQGLALHESLADLSALMMAFRSKPLRLAILGANDGDIESPNAFTAIAEQFGGSTGRGDSLRDVQNSRTMRDLAGTQAGPHALSEVLSGTLYRMMLRIYDKVSKEKPEKASGYWLFVASERFKRMLLRGLDYLPPGEVNFADFARAVLASDLGAHPNEQEPRDWLVEEFVARGIADSPAELDMPGPLDNRAFREINLEELVASDWHAYQFVDQHRALLDVPAGIPFEVRPRLVVSKSYYHRGKDPEERKELFLKVSWSHLEPCRIGAGMPQERRIIRGSTVAVDWASKRILAIVSSRDGARSVEARDEFLRRLRDDGVLAIGEAAMGPQGKPLSSMVRGEVIAGALRIRSTAKALHISGCRHD